MLWHNVQQLIDKGDFTHAEEELQLIPEEATLVKEIFNLKIQLGKSNFNFILQNAPKLLKTYAIGNQDLHYFQIQNIYTEALWKSNYFEKAIEITKELENNLSQQTDEEFKTEYGYLLNNQARISIYTGDFRNAETYAKKSIEIREKLLSKVDLSETYNVLGIMEWYEGKNDQAIEFFEKSLELRKEVGNIKLIAYSLNNIGEIYRIRGEIKKSFDCYDQCYQMSSLEDDIEGIRLGLIGKGTILMNKGEFDLALGNFEEFLSYLSDSLSPFLQIEALFNIVRLKLLMKLDYSKQLEIIRDLGNKFHDKRIVFYLQLTEAFIVKENPRIKTKLSAQDLFENILSKDIVNMEYTMLVMESLVELYLIELQISDNSQLLERINQLISDMLDLAQKQHLYPFMIKTIILQSRLALLNDDIGNCLHILEKATQLVQEKELSEFLPLIESENAFVNSELTKWQTLVESDASMYQRIKESNLLNYLQDIRKIFEN